MLVTFGCKLEGMDSGHFAKYFMKNKEVTTQIHYNLYANHREALKLAMQIGDSFKVGGVVHSVGKTEMENLTNVMLNSDEIVPTKEDILVGINKYNSIDSKEVLQTF